VTEAIIEGLRAVPIFATLDDDAIARAAAIAGIDEHAKGSVLIERGLPGAGLFVILDGTVAVELQHRTVELGPGEFVGELSLLSEHMTRSARVRAATDVRAIAIARHEFVGLLNEHPQIAVAMLPSLAQRLQDLIEHPA
jgi:CRP/FNR family cyclic AMP-dependent transcriptional regulator